MLLLLPPAADEGICFVVERCCCGCGCLLAFVLVVLLAVVVVVVVAVTSLLFTALMSVIPK